MQIPGGGCGLGKTSTRGRKKQQILHFSYISRLHFFSFMKTTWSLLFVYNLIEKHKLPGFNHKTPAGVLQQENTVGTYPLVSSDSSLRTSVVFAFERRALILASLCGGPRTAGFGILLDSSFLFTLRLPCLAHQIWRKESAFQSNEPRCFDAEDQRHLQIHKMSFPLCNDTFSVQLLFFIVCFLTNNSKPYLHVCLIQWYPALEVN